MVEAPTLEEELVTGSRIRRDATEAAMLELDRDDLAGTGLTNLGDALQNLPITGSAPNSQFNVPGNSVFPQDGSGIGAGSAQVSLRNFGAKRTLVLVDGRRWVAGASAVYGSDAIGGVVNIVTDRDFEGLHVDAQAGGYLQHGDGESTALDARWGVGNGTTHVVLSASWRDELGIGTPDRRRSAFPNPDATSGDVPGSYCSSFTPQGRFVLGPAFDFASITLNDGVLNDGGAHVPAFDPADPTAGDFHAFTSAARASTTCAHRTSAPTCSEPRANASGHSCSCSRRRRTRTGRRRRRRRRSRCAWATAAAIPSTTASSCRRTTPTTPLARICRWPTARSSSSAAAPWNRARGCFSRTRARTSRR